MVMGMMLMDESSENARYQMPRGARVTGSRGGDPKKQIYKSRDLAKAAITDCIETFYNRRAVRSVVPTHFTMSSSSTSNVSTALPGMPGLPPGP
jgi:hypothetical protein